LQCEYLALEGLAMLLRTIEGVQRRHNKKLSVGGIVFTMYDGRTRLTHEVVREVTGYFQDLVFRTVIPRNVRLAEAPSYAQPICEYAPSSIGAKSYRQLAEEFVARV
jgi:chromosome partitioning protein